MKIRSAKVSDIKNLILFLKKNEMYNKHIDKESIIRKKILHDKESIIVASSEENIIACIFIVFDPWRSHLHHFVVDKKIRNRGVGTKLLKNAEDLIKKRKCELATLCVNKNEEQVIGFYRKRKWNFVPYESSNMEKVF